MICIRLRKTDEEMNKDTERKKKGKRQKKNSISFLY